MSRPHVAELSVKDLALVSELRLELAPGLTVLTGETGAGKSMLVDALLAATGGRVAAGMVREGAERAKVEAVFTGAGDEVRVRRLLHQMEERATSVGRRSGQEAKGLFDELRAVGWVIHDGEGH